MKGYYYERKKARIFVKNALISAKTPIILKLLAIQVEENFLVGKRMVYQYVDDLIYQGIVKSDGKGNIWMQNKQKRVI